LIVGVFIDSPADKAGIVAGDIVVAVDGKPVLGIRDLLDQVTMHKPGEKVQIRLFRGPLEMTLEMAVEQRPH